MTSQGSNTETAELPDGTQYVVRPFESGDETEVCQIYDHIRGEKPAASWLDWKFRKNPQSSGVAMFVAEGPDGILGIRPFIPVRMRFGDRFFDAVCFVNALVRPEFRGRGVFSALTDKALAYHTSGKDLLFCFANDNSTPIYEYWGWQAVREEVTHFRFNNPSAIAGMVHEDLDLLFRPLSTYRIHLSLFDRQVPTNDDVEVKCLTDVPAERLAEIYQRGVPEKLHIVRDEEYYRWRLDDPHQNWKTYIAMKNGEDTGAVITRSFGFASDGTRLEVEDAVFVSNSSTRNDAMTALLSEVISDNEARDVIAVPDMLFPRELLRKRGFVATDWPLLSKIYSKTFTPLTLFTKPLSDIEPDVTDPENWLVSSLIRTTN